jgi:hypothetical protein
MAFDVRLSMGIPNASETVLGDIEGVYFTGDGDRATKTGTSDHGRMDDVISPVIASEQWKLKARSSVIPQSRKPPWLDDRMT